MRISYLISAIIGLIVVLALVAPGILQSLARSAIEEGFDTRSVADAEAAALALSAPELARMDEADLILSVSEDHLVPLLSAALSQAAKEHGITLNDVEVSFSRQGIRLIAVADVDVPDRDVSSIVKFLGDAKIGLANEKLVITPALSGVEIQELNAGSLFIPKSVAGVLSSAITTAIDAINAAVDPVEIDTPALSLEADIVRIGTSSVEIPRLEIGASAVLVDEDRIAWMGQVTPARESVKTEESFDAYRNRFQAVAGQLLEGLPADGFRMAPGLLGPIYDGLVDAMPLDERVRLALERARASAIAIYRTDLATYRPDLALFLPSGLVRSAVEPQLLGALQEEAKKSGIDVVDAGIAFEDGYLALHVEGNLPFQDPVPGFARIRVVVTAIPSFIDGRVEIRPGIQEVLVQEAEAEGYDLADLLASVNGILSGLITSLDAALPVIPISVDPYSVGLIDLNKQSAVNGVTFSQDVIEGPTVALSNASVFISESGLFLMAEVTSDANSLVVPVNGTPEIAPGIDGLEGYFLPFAQPGLAAPDPQIGGAALSWSRLAELINAEFADLGDFGAHVRKAIPRTQFESTKIELVERPNYQCRGPDDCPFRSCASECRRQDCSYSCPSVCTKIPEFRGLKVTFKNKCVEEPGCVSGREICKGGREAGYGACVLACNTAANTNVAACQTANVARQAGCELGKRIQDLGAEVGGVGVIGGDAGAKPDVNVGITSLHFNPDRLAGELTARLSGSVKVDGSVSFVPYDTMNILGCPKGKVEFSTNAAIPAQSITLDVSVVKDPEPDESNGIEDLDLLVTVSALSLKGDLVFRA